MRNSSIDIENDQDDNSPINQAIDPSQPDAGESSRKVEDMNATILNSLMTDARNELNGRTKGRDARLDRLAAAGIPTARNDLAEWSNARLDEALEASGGVYHVCTARISSGVDGDLPTKGKCGCRISRVEIKATLYPAGFEFTDEDGPLTEAIYLVRWANVGTGFMEPKSFTAENYESADEVERMVRQNLLAKDCFLTRAEAIAAAIEMLNKRVENGTQQRDCRRAILRRSENLQ